MAAVANPHNFTNLNGRPPWIGTAQPLNPPALDDSRGILIGRKGLSRSNSVSSTGSTLSTSSNSSTSSASSSSTNTLLTTPPPVPAPSEPPPGWTNPTPKKRSHAKGPSDMSRMQATRQSLANGHNAGTLSALQQSQNAHSASGAARQASSEPTQLPILGLSSLNGTFDRKTICVPFYPETLKIGRQTNAKTLPSPINGYFDSKVLSRQHAEIWAERNGKIWIRDVKSSNGTFVNNHRLSPENRESEPHELQVQDQLELGIDIVSEDQKTVVHRKVAARVEHAGFANNSNSNLTSLLDVNLGDLDPSNSAAAAVMGTMPMRTRAGRLVPAAVPRQMLSNPITMEQIVRKLNMEMRNARLQAQDLQRTSQFLQALLSSSDDPKHLDKSAPPESAKPAHLVNGNGTSASFRQDRPKTRFSDPPAPPPQQPLPEKPDVAARENGLLKRGGPADRQRSAAHPHSASSPIRHDATNQIFQLTEALSNAQREMSTQSIKLRELEERLQRERKARERAECMITDLENDRRALLAQAQQLAQQRPSTHDAELESAFNPPVETPLVRDDNDKDNGRDTATSAAPSDPPVAGAPDAAAAETAVHFQSRIDAMMREMEGLRDQLQAFKQRAEQAEQDRDADRKTLAELVVQMRQREEQDRRAADRRRRSASLSRSSSPVATEARSNDDHKTSLSPGADDAAASGAVAAAASTKPSTRPPLPSHVNTKRQGNGELEPAPPPQQHLVVQGMPYASMLGVVLIGVGLMAYINAWQPQPRLSGR